MTQAQKYFQKLLKEDIRDESEMTGDPSLDATPEEERDAFRSSLDDDISAEDYDVNPQSFRAISDKNIEEAREWIEYLEKFAGMINDYENTSSLNHFLNRVDREGSVFRGIVRSQGKRLTRMAEEAAAMAEVIGSHVVGSERKTRELMQQFPNLRR